MGQAMKEGSYQHPFNSSLETGIRALVVLEAFYPKCCDLLEMTWLDHLVVHTRDLSNNAPKSLHPRLPNRTGELLVRRPLIEKSLHMMHQMHLIDITESKRGIEYRASEEAPSYLDLLQSPYSLALKKRAQWLAEYFAEIEITEMRELIENQIGRWTANFSPIEMPYGASK